MTIRSSLGPVAVAAALAFGFGAAGAAAQGTLFCMRDGQQVKADRFETRNGRFYLYIAGASAPLEYPTAAVAGINVACTMPVQPQGGAGTAAPPPISADAGFGVHGSNTIGERLMPMLVEAFGTKKFGTRPTAKLGEPEEQELTLRGASGPSTVVQLHAHGSGTASKSLISGAALIGMSSRQANDAEAQATLAAHRVDIRTPGNEHVLALDGLAVIVHPSNGIRQLTLDQLAQIFSGQIKNWNQVGGNNAEISVHRRDDKSGTYDTFNALVLSPRKLKPSPTAKAHESSETLSEEVFRDTNAIGFIGLPYVNRNKALLIGENCGIASGASKYNIKAESYPLARRLYLYTLGQPRHPLAQDLLRFAMSDEAQPVIQEAGFVEQTVEYQDDADQRQWIDGLLNNPTAALPAGKQVPDNAKAALAGAVGSLRRTSLVLRFDRASANLDTRAQQDVARFARFLNSPAAQGKNFTVVGFADSDGAWQANIRLAAERAASVWRALQTAGVAVRPDQQVSFSYLAPVACNDTDAGKAKNRRVEIWMTK